MDELENCSNRYYHLEEISIDEIDLGKESELIPVAHYTKVNYRFIFSSCRMLTKQNSEFCRLMCFFPLNSAGVYRILREFFHDF